MKILQVTITTTLSDSITEVLSALSSFEVYIIDLFHVDTHGSISLSFLLSIHQDSAEEFVKEILYLGYLRGFVVQIRSLDKESYKKWLYKKKEKNFILTLLGWDITGKHIKEVVDLINKNGLSINFINRLSETKPFENTTQKSINCIEFYLTGKRIDIQHIHTDILDLSQRLGIDLGFQEDNIYRRHRRLIAFDMDSTLIQTEIIDELAKRAGVYEKVKEITQKAMEEGIDFKQSLIYRVSLLKGLEISVLKEVADNLPLTEGAFKLIKILKLLGYKIAIISGGFTFFGEALKKSLNIDYLFANQLEIKNNRLTGRVKGEIIDGKKKAEILKTLAKREKISLEQVIAVGDGMNDLPMLKIAGLGIAFRAKPMVKKGAKQAISNVGLDGILYFLGLKESELSSLSV